MERKLRVSVLLAIAIVGVTLFKQTNYSSQPIIQYMDEVATTPTGQLALGSEQLGPFYNDALVDLPSAIEVTPTTAVPTVQLVQFEEEVATDEEEVEAEPNRLKIVLGPTKQEARRLADAKQAVTKRAKSKVRFVTQESAETAAPARNQTTISPTTSGTQVVVLPDVQQDDDMEIVEPPVVTAKPVVSAVVSDVPEMEIIEPPIEEFKVTSSATNAAKTGSNVQVITDNQDVIDQIEESLGSMAKLDKSPKPKSLAKEPAARLASRDRAKTPATLMRRQPKATRKQDKLSVAKHKNGTSVVDLPVEAYEVVSNTNAAEKTAEQSDDGPARVVNASDAWYLPLEELTPEHEARRQRIRQALEFYYNRMLNTTEDSPWSMMHHMIAWGADAYVWVGKPGDKRVSCIGWLCANGSCENARLLELKDGKLSAKTGPGLQGHGGQFLAMLAQARVRAEQPIRCEGEMFTVEDLIEAEKARLKPGEELTFKMMGLIHYLGTESTWTANNGQEWDFPRMIREEIKQPINGTTCGGTHRLMGLSYAVRRRIQEGYELDGQWARAAKYTADYREYAYALRNSDGTFSSDFFRSRGSWGDLDRKVKTNGHVLEWLVFSSPHDELEDPRLVRSIDILTQWLSQNRYYDWGKGPMAHAVRALSLYDERVYGGEPGKRTLKLASRPVKIQPKPAKTKTERQMMIEATQPATMSKQKTSRKSPSGIRRLFRRGGGWQ
jgi:hypothetical protein